MTKKSSSHQEESFTNRNDPIEIIKQDKDVLYICRIHPDLEAYSIYVTHKSIFYINNGVKVEVDLDKFPLKYRFGEENVERIREFLNV